MTSLWRDGFIYVRDNSPRFCPVDGIQITDVRIDKTTIPNPAAPPFELGNFEALPTCDGTLQPCGHRISFIREVLRDDGDHLCRDTPRPS